MHRVGSAARRLLGSALVLALAGCGAGGAAGSGAADGQLAAVATTSVIADLVRNVGGERVHVTALLKPGMDPHTYAPAPADVQTVADAQVLFENGLGLESWLEELTANAGGTRSVVVVSQGLTPLGGAVEQTAGETASPEAARAAEGADPHMWFDVTHTLRYVENIRAGLKAADPDGAAVYDANAAAYSAQLQQLDADITAQVQSIPAERRKLLTNHDTFAYFAQRYGFTVVGSVFEGVSTEEEPSAQQVAALVRAIKEQGVPAVFTENTVNPRLAQQIGDEAGVKVVTDLYTDALGEPGSSGDTYIKMMRHDVEQIVAALR